MGAPNTTTWELDPHTRAKHEILQRYLEAWTPILSLAGFPTIAYVDGFAGPGIYSSGEDGSPIIALKAALQHRDKVTANVLFLFIEKQRTRAERLEQIVSGLDLPGNFRVRVAGGKTFEEGFRENLLDFYEKQRRPVPPIFAFIDPFGWTGVPFALVKEIFPVGRLVRLASPAKGYEFAYLRAAADAQARGFTPFLTFPELEEVYRSPELPPFFQNRLMPRARPDFPDQLTQIGLGDDASAEQILARTGGRRATDPYELFGEFEPTEAEHEWETHFFVRSLRHLELLEIVDRLAPGQPLFCMADAQNPVDRSAIALRTASSAIAGYCPAYLVDEILPLLRSDPSAVRISVKRVNPEPAPLQYRVQCHLRIRTEAGFHAYRSGRFEPISPKAIRLSPWVRAANVA